MTCDPKKYGLYKYYLTNAKIKSAEFGTKRFKDFLIFDVSRILVEAANVFNL